MTHGHDHGITAAAHVHGFTSAPSATQPPFTSTEWESFQADDRHTAAVFITLMTSIFVIGLLLYVGVCLAITNGV